MIYFLEGDKTRRSTISRITTATPIPIKRVGLLRSNVGCDDAVGVGVDAPGPGVPPGLITIPHSLAILCRPTSDFASSVVMFS